VAAPLVLPSPELLAVREGLAAAFDDVVGSPKAIPAPPAGSWGVVSEGTGGGGIFRDSDSEAEAWLGANSTGVTGYGSTSGGYFQSSTGSGLARLGWGDWGIAASGDYVGAYIADADGSGHAWLGYDRPSGTDAGGNANAGEYGVYAGGSKAGAYFEDADNVGFAYIGYGDQGIKAWGSYTGGFFGDSGGSGFAWLGFDRPSGTDAGGNANDGEYGVYAGGNEAGGYFEDTDSTGYAYVGSGNRGIEGSGSNAGGHFEDSDDSGHAYVGYGDRGIEAYGSNMGGYFADSDGGGTAYAGWGDHGIYAGGLSAGGWFRDTDSSGDSYVAAGTYKIMGTGTDSFVQNHPQHASRVVVYHAPEASEVAVYTRGSARLEDGRAVIALDPTFVWVTNPDLGLTVHLTPRVELVDLAVESLTTADLVVVGPAGSAAAFDYMVWGLRIGFEELAPVQPKEREAYIPSMKDHRDLYASAPDLRPFNALERFSSTERELRGLDQDAPLDLGRAEALREAIHEFDPTVDAFLSGPDVSSQGRLDRPSVRTGSPPSAAAASQRGRSEGEPTLPSMPSVDADGTVTAPSFRAERSELALELPSAGGIGAGDVVALDPETGLLVAAAVSGDARVVGVAAGEAGVILGGGAPDGPGTRVVFSGVTRCRVDAGYGVVVPGDLLTASPTPGHAMRAADPMPGSVVAKALESLAEGQGTIRVLVMLR
jgi:hypothetical protein